MDEELKEGMFVYKPNGYSYDGKIVSKFSTHDGRVRFVVEEADSGMLHIFNADQIEKLGHQEAVVVEWRMNNREAVEERLYYMIKEIM